MSKNKKLEFLRTWANKKPVTWIANQIGIDGIVNPSAKDINRQVKNIAKQPAA